MLPFIADLMGFLGSLLLAWPALRLSAYLKQVKRVEGVQLKRNDADPLTATLLSTMKNQASEWNALDHGLMIAGFGFLVLSFLLQIVPAICGYLFPATGG